MVEYGDSKLVSKMIILVYWLTSSIWGVPVENLFVSSDF